MARPIVRRSALALVVLAGAGALAWALWPQPASVDVAVIERGALEVTVEDDGITRIREVYAISAPTSGKMLRNPLKVGDPVIAGETVVAVFEPSAPAFLDTRTHRVNEAAAAAAKAAVQLAQAQLRQAQAQLTFARREAQRAEELAEQKAIPTRELEQRRLNAATAEASVASAEATLQVRRQEYESAKAQLIQPGQDAESSRCCIRVRAPITGRVLRVVAESEQVVQAGATLIELGDPNDLEIAVDLLSRDAVRVKPGDPARIENWGGDLVLNARVRRVEPTGFTKVSALGIEEQRVWTILDFTEALERVRELGHGYRVVVRITVWSGENLLLVPLGALFRRGADWAVFVVSEGRARLRTVQIDERDARSARVLSGLSEGDHVILHPGDQIQDGTRVAARP